MEPGQRVQIVGSRELYEGETATIVRNEEGIYEADGLIWLVFDHQGKSIHLNPQWVEVDFVSST